MSSSTGRHGEASGQLRLDALWQADWQALMDENRIERCGFNVTPARLGGYWDVTFYVRFEGHIGMRDVTYRNLSMTEMSDTILANLSDYAPGSVRVNGGHQDVLWTAPSYDPDDAA